MPTFYLENLNPGSTALDQAGEFGGAVTSQPATNSTTRVINVTTATAQGYFKFYMSGGRQGKSSGSNGTLEFDTPDTTRSDEFLQLLATEVFGSSESSDLFSNKSAIVSSWDTATGTTALDLLNGLINTAGADASLELVNAMFHTSNGTINRFTMSYGYTGVTGTVVTGTGYAVTSDNAGGGNGLGAKVNVTMDGSSVKSITVHTDPTTGAFAKGDTITITDGSSNTATILLNSYQAASLNGTLSADTGTEVPLENGDVIRVLYTITSIGTQEDTSGDTITATQTFFVDYTLN
jgi:hypothetical protein